MMQPFLEVLEEATRVVATTRNSNPDAVAYARETAAPLAALEAVARRIASGSSDEPASDLAVIEDAVVRILAAKRWPERERRERLGPLRARAFGAVVGLDAPRTGERATRTTPDVLPVSLPREARVEEAA